jgi:hypothetical protein
MKTQSGQGCGNAALVILALVLVGGIVFGVIQCNRSRRATAPFVDMVEEARAACAVCFSQGGGSTGAYLRGKVLVVEAETGQAVGLTMADLPEEIRATDPEQVGTLVCAGAVEQEQVGAYKDLEPAYQLHREFCVYDLQAGSVIGVERLAGGQPPPVKHEDGPASGSDPVRGALIDWLEGLPVR